MQEDGNTYYTKAPGTVNHDGVIYPPGAKLPTLKMNESRALLQNNAITTIQPKTVVAPLSTPGESEASQEDINALVAKLDGKTASQPAAAQQQTPPAGGQQGQQQPGGQQQQQTPPQGGQGQPAGAQGQQQTPPAR